MASVRMERGDHGEAAVPGHAYYGIRTLRAMARMPDTGRRYKDDLLVAMGALKKCAAETESGRLPPRVGALIERAAQEIIDGRWHDQFAFEPRRCGGGELLSVNVNEVLVNRTLELMGEDKGSYHILGVDWHADDPLYPNRFFTAAFQLAAMRFLQTMKRLLLAIPNGVREGIATELESLEQRLCVVNREHFDAKFAAKLSDVTGYPLRAGSFGHEFSESVPDRIAAAMKSSLSKLELAHHRFDSIELKASLIQVSAFRDMIAFVSRSGFASQGMEEVAAYYAWQCMELCGESLLQVGEVYR